MFFVNLTLRAVLREPERLDRYIAKGLNPELGMDPLLLDEAPMDWHRQVAARITAAGLACSVHLPFFDLQPGSVDSLVIEACRARLRKAVSVAAIYSPRHMVAHAGYDRFLYMHSYDPWRARAAKTFAAALGAWPDHAPIYLENTHETDPYHVAGLAEALADILPDTSKAGLCLDLGHWFSFAGGRQEGNLDAWLDAFAPHLRHLHLHDNDGSFDQHLVMGQGKIPWKKVSKGLAKRGLTPTATFEPHSSSAIDQTLKYVAAHQNWLAPLGVVA